MNRVVKALMKGGSKLAVALYKASNGRIAGKAVGGTPVLLLTVAGRRTGQPHTTALGYFEHAGGYLVVGSASGQPQDPQWFKNLRAADRAEVRVGERTVPVSIRELHGDERDTAWRDVVVARTPQYARYESTKTRTMPLALLTPTT